MYYPDETRYDQVDGTGPVVPFSRTARETGLTPLSRSLEHQVGRGQSCLTGIPGPERGKHSDGVSTLVPSFMTEWETGLDTWSRLF